MQTTTHVVPSQTNASPRLPGRYLFIGGSNLYHRLNSPAQHLPRHLAPYIEQLDTVGYINFYNGPPAPFYRRIARGMRNVITDRLRVTTDNASYREIVVRQLHLPTLPDMLLQDLWIFLALRPALAPVYDVGIVAHPGNALLAALLKRSGRVRRLVYNDWDYYPAFVSPRWSHVMAWRERLCLKLADGVVSVSHALADLRREQGARRVAVIPNGVNFEAFQAANRRFSHPPTLIYTGSVDMRWGVDLPIRALPALRAQFQDIRLLIVGEGPAKADLIRLAADSGVSDAVECVGYVPYSNLPAWMAQADIGLATSRSHAFRRYASPLKLVEYMAAGLPVICSGGGEAARIMDESNGGVHIDFTPDAFVHATQALLNDTTTRDTMHRAAVAYARAHDWSCLGQQLAHYIADIAGMQP